METSEEMGDDDLEIKIRQRKNSITNRNLLIAARDGDEDRIYGCIKENANINFVDRDGNTPLHYAIKSENAEIVKIFVNNVEDINAENNECKTPLDIATALKQNDVVEMLSEKNVAKSVEILQNKADQQSDDIVNDISFMEGTFHKDYKIPLSKEDIQNILDFKYFRRNGQKVFKAIEIKENIETKKNIENEIEEFTKVKKTTTLILNLDGKYWITLVLYYINKDNTDQFKAYYFDYLPSYGIDLPTYIIDLIRSKGIEISHIRLNLLNNLYDSGIFALKYAEEFNPFSNENEVKEMLQNLDIKKAREFYANILREKKRVEDKIAVCLETLQNCVDEQNKSDVVELNHKYANVFVNFLEAFALQDTFPTMSNEVWTQKEIKEKEKELKGLKKNYFCTYYYEPEDKKKSDFKLIDSARTKLLHSSKIMQLEDFVCFMKDKSSVSNFFKDLKDYTKSIKNKIDNNNENNYGEIYCYTFLASEINIEDRKEGNLLDIRNFLLEIYKPEDEIDQDKTIFNLTVNIMPIIEKNKEKVRLSEIRNNLVHSYQEKSILNNQKKFKEIKELHFLRSDLLRYFYSKKVHGLLYQILDKDIENLQDEFQKILEDFQKDINKEKNFSLIFGEHSKSFEYIFQESLFPESDENINSLVDKYLKYAFIVEKKAGAKEVPIDDDDEEEGEKIKYYKLTDDKKREIFEDFMKLKKNQELTHAKIQYERKKLKEKLKKYGLEVSYFDKIVRYYLDDANELPEEIIEKRNKIISNLSILKQVKKDFSLSNREIINWYEKILELKQKGIANLRLCGSKLDKELNKSKLTESQKSLILRKLYNFSGVETIDIMIGSSKITELNSFDIIRNILSVFCSSYNTYKIKFDNVEEAFNDDIFLDYLVNLNIDQNNSGKILKDRYFIFTIIKKLKTMEYASPYIAKLLIESNNDTVIEKEDFNHLLGILLKNNAYVKHLVKLLNMKSEKIDVFEEFCNQILDNDFNIENIHEVLQEYNHVEAILNKLNAKILKIKSNHLMEDEASKLEEFCNKLLNEDFNAENILQDYDDVKVILSKLTAKIENIKVGPFFNFKIKKVKEFCNKIKTNTNFDVTNVQDAFQKSKIKKYLRELKAKVVCREINYCKEKSVKTIEKITQQILKQLNIITDELHRRSCYDDVVKILNTSTETGKKLLLNDDLKIILLDAEFQKAKSIIQLTVIEKNKKRNIKRALGILRGIENKHERSPKFLLISAEIAYAERLLKKNSNS